MPRQCIGHAADPSIGANPGCTQAQEPLLLWESTKLGPNHVLTPEKGAALVSLSIQDP